MKNHTKKLLAPVVITILIVLYLIFYMVIGSIITEMPLYFKALVVVIPIGLIVLSVYMLFERIDEIKGGEEDDLSKY
nr:hypothetical protein [Tissierella sp.]